jgi:hypothetical protein
MGQNASPEGRAEMRELNTRMIGSVGYFPEKYGEEIVKLALISITVRCRPQYLPNISSSRRKTWITSTRTTD